MPQSCRRFTKFASRALLAAALTAGTLAGCAADPAGAPGAGGLEIHGLALSAQRLVGREGFDVTMNVRMPAGQAITAYVLKTPYEQTRHVLEMPLRPIQDGYIILQEVQFDREPVTGPYPVSIALEDDAGDQSNPLSGSLIVQ